MKRINNLLADIDQAWAQGNIGDTEAPVKYLIELVGILAHKIGKLETRTNRIERKQTGLAVKVMHLENEMNGIETVDAPVERMAAGESLKPADDE